MNFVRTLIKCNSNKWGYTTRVLSTLPDTVQAPLDEADKLYKVVELEMRGNDPAVLKSFAQFAAMSAKCFDIQCKSWNLQKPKHERYTILKSAHVHKKHRVQYEFRTYFTFVQYKYLTGSTAETILEYVQRNLPEGVALKSTLVELEKFPDHLKPPEDNNK